MYILGYIVLFLLVGFFIGKLVKNEAFAYGLILIITVSWGFGFGPWAFATLVELLVGYKLAIKVIDENDIVEDSFEDDSPLVLERKEKEDEEYSAKLKTLSVKKRIEYAQRLECYEKESSEENSFDEVIEGVFGKDERSPREKIVEEIQAEKEESSIFMGPLLFIVFWLLCLAAFGYLFG
jgi:hypothetical protein